MSKFDRQYESFKKYVKPIVKNLTHSLAVEVAGWINYAYQEAIEYYYEDYKGKKTKRDEDKTTFNYTQWRRTGGLKRGSNIYGVNPAKGVQATKGRGISYIAGIENPSGKYIPSDMHQSAWGTPIKSPKAFTEWLFDRSFYYGYHGYNIPANLEQASHLPLEMAYVGSIYIPETTYPTPETVFKKKFKEYTSSSAIDSYYQKVLSDRKRRYGLSVIH